jgi:phenylacetate-CoA ligase
MNFRKLIFIIGHMVLRPRVLFYYLKLKSNEKRSYGELRQEQVNRVLDYLKFCKEHVPYFKDRLSSIDLCRGRALDEVMSLLPIMKKEDIKANLSALQPIGVSKGGIKTGQTGGSTGTPLKYFISKECASMAQAMLYRGWSYGGYRLGDKVAVMAGGSLIRKDLTRRARLIAYLQNIRKYSSYGVSEDTFFQYFNDMKKWRPKFLRGYVSSIFEFAKFLERNNLTISFEAVFTTAEMLYPYQRLYIEKVLGGEVFNNYGLNDGSLTAFECKKHRGLHVDLERGYLEVRRNNGTRVGPVLATAFLNRATSFVRYDTGDIAELSDQACDCGLPYPLLKSLLGRQTDALNINGCMIGSPVLTVLMSGIDVRRYQFIQGGLASLEVIIDKGATYDLKDEDFIRSSLFSQAGSFDLKFIYDVKAFRNVSGGKHKLVISDV